MQKLGNIIFYPLGGDDITRAGCSWRNAHRCPCLSAPTSRLCLLVPTAKAAREQLCQERAASKEWLLRPQLVPSRGGEHLSGEQPGQKRCCACHSCHFLANNGVLLAASSARTSCGVCHARVISISTTEDGVMRT